MLMQALIACSSLSSLGMVVAGQGSGVALSPDVGHDRPMGQIIPVDTWGELEILEPADPIAPRLSAADFLWRDDERCWPSVLRTTLGWATPYVAVGPPDRPPHSDAVWSIDDLDGFVLAEPASSLRCFVCEQMFAGLYPDAGLPFFGQHLTRHHLNGRCPNCDADFTRSRLSALNLVKHSA